jgi:CheY-like chemotaxis protein
MELTNKKIAVFDDDEDILSICDFVLASSGWEVHTFSDCIDIVGKVTGVDPAVILMDNWIPDTGGIIATQLLKDASHLKHIPVIYFSANNKISDLAAQAGADAYLAKPFDLDDLERIVREHAINSEQNLL